MRYIILLSLLVFGCENAEHPQTTEKCNFGVSIESPTVSCPTDNFCVLCKKEVGYHARCYQFNPKECE